MKAKELPGGHLVWTTQSQRAGYIFELVMLNQKNGEIYYFVKERLGKKSRTLQRVTESMKRKKKEWFHN